MGRGVRIRRGATKTNGKWTGGTFEELASMRFGERELSKIYYGKGILLTDFTASPSSPGTPGESPSPSPTPASTPGGIDNTLAVGGSGTGYQSASSYSYPSSTWATENSVPSTFYSRGNAFGNKSGASYVGCCYHKQFNGTSWSTGTSVPVQRRFQATGGSANAGMNWSGCVSPTAVTNCGEEWDGSSWSTLPTSPSNRGTGKLPTGGGTTNSFFVHSGASCSPYAGYFNGTSWAACAQTPTYTNYQEGFGTIDSAVSLVCAPSTSGTTPSTEWSGTAWGSGISFPNVRWAGGAGTGASEGLTAGNYPALTSTYEYNSPTYSVGGNLPTGNFHIGVTT